MNLLNERSSFAVSTDREGFKEMVLKEVRVKSKVLQSSVMANSAKGDGYCSVLIGDEVPGKTTVTTLPPPVTDDYLSVQFLLNIIESYMEDCEVISSVMYCLAIMVLDVKNRTTFKSEQGIKTVLSVMKKHSENIPVLRCCCSVFANVGPFVIDSESIRNIENISDMHKYDHFIATALCATYANFARTNSKYIVDNGILSKMIPLLHDRTNTDLQYSVLAAYSNVARNSSAGQRKCVELKIHTIIIQGLLDQKCTAQYWRVASNTLGCLAVNGMGCEQIEVVKHASSSGLIDKMVDMLHIIYKNEPQEKRYERMYGCLAKFALVRQIRRIPRLSWLCLLQCNSMESVPYPLQALYKNGAFKCHVCKRSCDPYLMRTIRYDEKLVLMSYCSVRCWRRRHAI
ncbi:Uncharacterized protein QTN25_000228 [Entamoeba marina]